MTTPKNLKQISLPVSKELDTFDRYLREQMKTTTPLLDTVVRYILRRRGKRARPTLVFLSAGMTGSIGERSYVGATMVELLHTATLVHDDVVDSSNERRGFASINAVWKNKLAVLVGDFLLSKGLLIAVNNDEFDFLKVTSEAVRRMSEGELLQIQKSRQKSIDEETYFKIISDKTASLISACCEIGAISSGANEDVRKRMRVFGENIGLAFQIRDDVLDYTSRTSVLGKPVGNDILEQKITIPLIYACNNAPLADGKAMVKLVKGKKPTRKTVHEVMRFVERYKGVEAAQLKAKELQALAIRQLDGIPESDYKTSLIDFANFVVTRAS